MSGAIRSGLRSYTDVCDAVFAVEIALRFLGKMGGPPGDSLLTYLTDTLKMGPQISGSVKKVGVLSLSRDAVVIDILRANA